MSFLIYNGKIVPAHKPCIQAYDRGLTLGHGLFETILVKENVLCAWDYHWQRLSSSTALIDIPLPFTKEALSQMLLNLVAKNGLQHKRAVARLTVTQGESAGGILPLSIIKPNYLISVYEHKHQARDDFKALVVSTRKNENALSARIKSISYLDNVLAKREAQQRGFDEAILLNSASNIADGAVTNIFMVKNNVIFTPPIQDGALPGVTRERLLNDIRSPFPIQQQSFNLQALLTADEVFVTNALIGLQPVTQVNETKFTSFAIGQLLSEQFTKMHDEME